MDGVSGVGFGFGFGCCSVLGLESCSRYGLKFEGNCESCSDLVKKTETKHIIQSLLQKRNTLFIQRANCIDNSCAGKQWLVAEFAILRERITAIERSTLADFEIATSQHLKQLDVDIECTQVLLQQMLSAVNAGISPPTLHTVSVPGPEDSSGTTRCAFDAFATDVRMFLRGMENASAEVAAITQSAKLRFLDKRRQYLPSVLGRLVSRTDFAAWFPLQNGYLAISHDAKRAAVTHGLDDVSTYSLPEMTKIAKFRAGIGRKIMNYTRTIVCFSGNNDNVISAVCPSCAFLEELTIHGIHQRFIGKDTISGDVSAVDAVANLIAVAAKQYYSEAVVYLLEYTTGNVVRKFKLGPSRVFPNFCCIKLCREAQQLVISESTGYTVCSLDGNISWKSFQNTQLRSICFGRHGDVIAIPCDKTTKMISVCNKYSSVFQFEITCKSVHAIDFVRGKLYVLDSTAIHVFD